MTSIEADLQFDVIVVGAGPVGLCFATALQNNEWQNLPAGAEAEQGLRIAIIEKKDDATLANPAFDGRGITLTHKTVDRLNELGIWGNIPTEAVHRLKETEIYDGSGAKLTFRQPNYAGGIPTDRLGYFVPFQLIKQASYTQAKAAENITWFTSTEITSLNCDVDSVNGKACAITSDGQRLYAKLVVAADSRFSTIRRQLGIACDKLESGRSALVCHVSHPASNEHTAYEFFHEGHTLSLRPLGEQLSNCVVTAPTADIMKLATASEEVLLAYFHKTVHDRFGKLTLASTVHSHPLVTAHAKTFYAENGVLIGDAAVGMHPVTSHGLNLGLRGAWILAKLIRTAHSRNQAINAPELLAEYERQQMLRSRPLYHATNSIIKIFGTDNLPANVLRRVLLTGGSKLPRIREMLTNRLVG